jgi:tetratricopeptide (TPR) repeat protein
VVTRLASELRTALGDNTSDSAQRFAMETLSATSLDVVREYAVAQQATSDGRFDAARASFSKAIALDPNFGYAYAAMGNAQRNLGLQQEAEKSVTEALRHIDRMTERERLRTRGLYYLVTGDHLACVKEYGALIERFPADASAHNNVALCSTYLRNLPKAVEEMRRVVQILPKRALYRVNLGLFAAYSSDFQTAEREALTAQQLGNPLGLLPLAFAYLGQNKLSEATAAYENLAKASAQGASFAASGLADQALYEGRFSDAARILHEGAAKDLTSGSSDKAARKFVALAQTELLRKRNNAATTAAKTALTHTRVATIRFLAARTFVEVGDLSTAQMLGAELMSELRAEPRALAKIIEGEIALKNSNPRVAIQALEEANALLDTWIGRFDLGRAYFEAGAFPQADSEFDRCLMRRGEALALFLDEEATYGLLPPVYYYQGRVREELKTAGFAESYRTYLNIRGKSTEDPLVSEVRRRADSKLGDPR